MDVLPYDDDVVIRRWFYVFAAVLLAGVAAVATYFPVALWALLVVGPLLLLGLHDSLQREHTILRNFPLLGQVRYLFEMVRPEIQQYFIESNTDAFPIEREFRDIVYQRAKGELETQPFGTSATSIASGTSGRRIRWHQSRRWRNRPAF